MQDSISFMVIACCGERLLKQHRPLIRQPWGHGHGLIQVPAAVGVNLHVHGPGPAFQFLNRGLHQLAIMVQALGAAEFQLDAAGMHLVKPLPQALPHRRHGAEANGHAGGPTALPIQAPETPKGLSQGLAPPVPERQVHPTAGWGGKGLK